MKVHKLTKKEIEKIISNYNLGKLKSFKLFSGGLVNFNYELRTEKGLFVIRLIGHKITTYKKQKLELEKNILLFLHKRKFPYEIPYPLANKKGKYHSKINGKTYWIYKMLHGKSVKRLNNKQFKEMVKALATYHEYLKDFKVDKSDKDIFSVKWIIDKYAKLTPKLKKINSKNKTDKLVKENFGMFKQLLDKISQMDFKTNLIVVHGDINLENLLFRDNKLKAILDFDNLQIAPRVEDVAYTLRLSVVGKNGLDKKRMKLFIKEYEKVHKLSKKEKEMIIPLMLRSNVIVFWWMYEEMEKGLDKKYSMIKWTVDITKVLVKEWEKQGVKLK